MDTPLAVLVLGAHRPAPSRELKALISEQSRLPLLLSSSAVGLQAEPPHLHPMGGGLASQVKAQSRNTTAAASYRRMQVTAARQQEILTSEHPHYYIYLYIFFLHRFQKSKLNKRSFHCRWAPGAPTWASLCYRSSTPCQNGPKVPQNAVKCQGSSQHLACFGGRRGRTTVSKRHFHKIHSFGGGMEFGCISCFAADTLNKSSAERFAKRNLPWGRGEWTCGKQRSPLLGAEQSGEAVPIEQSRARGAAPRRRGAAAILHTFHMLLKIFNTGFPCSQFLTQASHLFSTDNKIKKHLPCVPGPYNSHHMRACWMLV